MSAAASQAPLWMVYCMPPRERRRRNQAVSRNRKSAIAPRPWALWLAPPIGILMIVGLAATASLAQSTEWVFIAASMLFSLCEGVVLAVVGFIWSRKGIAAAMAASIATAVVAAPARWEVTVLMRSNRPAPEQTDLLADLAVSIAWGAIAGLAGATILRPKLSAILQDAESRFTKK